MKRLIQLAALALMGLVAGCRGPGPSVVVYTKSGGIAMLDDTLDVRESGAMTLSQRRGGVKAGLATPEELDRLWALFNTPEFAALPGDVRAKGFDLITYTIKAETNKGLKTVTTMDGVEHPKVLTDVMYELLKLEEKCK